MTVVASNYTRQGNDLYQTEPWATECLLRHFPVLGKSVWETAAGNHLMADVLTENGAVVRTADIKRYDVDHDITINFFSQEAAVFFRENQCDCMITNPPYGAGNRDAVLWASVSLARCSGLVALLLTAKFDFGKTRQHLFRKNARFLAKIALLDRIQWFPGATTGTEDHAWYVWGAEAEAPYVPRMYWEGKIANEH